MEHFKSGQRNNQSEGKQWQHLKIATIDHSGTIYTLDTVAPAYKDWCSENNIELNLEDPVVIK